MSVHHIHFLRLTWLRENKSKLCNSLGFACSHSVAFCFPPSFFSVSFWTSEWQLLFPQQPCANRDGETRLHPPLEENETKSKHSSPEGETEEWRRESKEDGADGDGKRQRGGKKRWRCMRRRQTERQTEEGGWECEQNMRQSQRESDKQIEAWKRSDGVGADTDLSCGMRRETGSDTLHWLSPLSRVQTFASTHKLILTLLSWIIGSAVLTNNLALVFTQQKASKFCFSLLKMKEMKAREQHHAVFHQLGSNYRRDVFLSKHFFYSGWINRKAGQLVCSQYTFYLFGSNIEILIRATFKCVFHRKQYVLVGLDFKIDTGCSWGSVMSSIPHIAK